MYCSTFNSIQLNSIYNSNSTQIKMFINSKFFLEKIKKKSMNNNKLIQVNLISNEL